MRHPCPGADVQSLQMQNYRAWGRSQGRDLLLRPLRGRKRCHRPEGSGGDWSESIVKVNIIIAGLSAMHTTRRDVLRLGVAVASMTAGLVARSSAETDTGATPPSIRKGDMLYRALGSTGEQVSLVGLAVITSGGRAAKRRGSARSERRWVVAARLWTTPGTAMATAVR